jgi:hypothetical protein
MYLFVLTNPASCREAILFCKVMEFSSENGKNPIKKEFQEVFSPIRLPFPIFFLSLNHQKQLLSSNRIKKLNHGKKKRTQTLDQLHL